MAHDVPPGGGSPQQGAAWGHHWHPYVDYQTVHHSHIDRLTRAGIIVDSHLSFLETVEDGALVEVNLYGRISCAEDVYIDVDKVLEVDRAATGQILVQGKFYKYHAWLATTPERDLVRYCTAYGLADLHRHEFDLVTGRQIGRPPRISLDDLPTLGDFIPQAVELGRRARGV